ncbi:MAG: xanthine dehydrogenase family protein subunit M [Armatimonadota bacterium]|nr:xanthine dehydrogenase family protein subunit M [Armatimonadota bacterium]
MKPPVFDYQDPASVEEALELLARHGAAAKVLAGGQSLMPLLNLRLARPEVVVDINRIDALDYLTEESGWLRVGARVRQRRLEREAEVRRMVPLLTEAVRFVGHPQIRNRGTVCGSLAHADPAAELPAVAVAVGARLVARSRSGVREIPAEEFFTGPLTTALRPDELLAEARFPCTGPDWGWAFLEVSNRHGDYALCAVAAGVRAGDGRIQDARLAYAGAGPVPVRLREAEAALVEHSDLEEGIRAASAEARRVLQPDGDLHASSEFRRHLAAVLTARTVRLAWTRARTCSGGAHA